MSIDEPALAKTQDQYAFETNGIYKDMSVRKLIEFYEAAKLPDQPVGCSEQWLACSQALSLLTATAAKLVRGDGFTSRFEEDHDRLVSKWMLECLDNDDTRRVSLGRDIASAIEVLRPYLKAPTRESGEHICQLSRDMAGNCFKCGKNVNEIEDGAPR